MPDTDTVDSCMNTSVSVWRPGWFPTVTWSEDVRRWCLVPCVPSLSRLLRQINLCHHWLLANNWNSNLTDHIEGSFQSTNNNYQIKTNITDLEVVNSLNDVLVIIKMFIILKALNQTNICELLKWRGVSLPASHGNANELLSTTRPPAFCFQN